MRRSLNHFCDKCSFVYTIIIVDRVKQDIHISAPLCLNLIVKSTNANKEVLCVSAVHALFLFQFRFSQMLSIYYIYIHI